MAKPIVVNLRHNLGAAEAKRRICQGIERAKTDFSAIISAVDAQWVDNHADIHVVAARQSITSGLNITDNFVHLELQLPWYFAPIQEKIAAILEKQGSKALQLGHN